MDYLELEKFIKQKRIVEKLFFKYRQQFNTFLGYDCYSDVEQEIILAAWLSTRHENFDSSQNYEGYIYVACHNYILKILSAFYTDSRIVAQAISYDNSFVESLNYINLKEQKDGAKRLLEDIKARLTPSENLLLELILNDFSNEEIAKIRQTTTGSIRTAKTNLFKKIRTKCKKIYREEI